MHSAGTDSEADIDRAASIAADLIQRFNFVSLSNFPQDYDNKTEGWGGVKKIAELPMNII